jgi:hypothetical protein
MSNSTQQYGDAVFVDLLNAIAGENHLAKEFSDALVFALNVGKRKISPPRKTLRESGERRRA